MATDFTKIATHPEIKEIISKLVSGESPKLVSKYLKDKYPKPDEGHLRIPATQLQEFLDSYADHNGYIQKIVKRDTDSKLDKKIAESLLDTASWKERVINGIEKEINYIDHLNNIVTILETRAEQLFDLIQSDPENTRTDYIFTKYMEQLMIAIEKADKIRNDKPDVRIEHTYTVQMVEQQTVAFQEAIRRVLERMGPEYTSVFMDILAEEMKKIDVKDIHQIPKSRDIDVETHALNKFDNTIQEMDSKFLEEGIFDE
jgi:hypothetical protein